MRRRLAGQDVFDPGVGEADLAGGRFEEAGNDLQHRAGPCRSISDEPQQRDQFARCHREVHVVERHRRAEYVPDLDQLQRLAAQRRHDGTPEIG